jgi:hypothetical protein
MLSAFALASHCAVIVNSESAYLVFVSAYIDHVGHPRPVLYVSDLLRNWSCADCILLSRNIASVARALDLGDPRPVFCMPFLPAHSPSGILKQSAVLHGFRRLNR